MNQSGILFLIGMCVSIGVNQFHESSLFLEGSESERELRQRKNILRTRDKERWRKMEEANERGIGEQEENLKSPFNLRFFNYMISSGRP